MNIQAWVSELLATTEPLDWERYSVTMEAATWKALWADIAATEEFDDGLEAALRLLNATQVHRARLGAQAAEANEILLYRSLLSMLDKAERWESYLATWETIWARTRLCLLVPRDTLAGSDARLTAFMRRPDGGFGTPPLTYSANSPKKIALHFLYTQSRRKATIERKLGRKDTSAFPAERQPLGPNTLTAEAIQLRLAQIQDGGS